MERDSSVISSDSSYYKPWFYSFANTELRFPDKPPALIYQFKLAGGEGSLAGSITNWRASLPPSRTTQAAPKASPQREPLRRGEGPARRGSAGPHPPANRYPDLTAFAHHHLGDSLQQLLCALTGQTAQHQPTQEPGSHHPRLMGSRFFNFSQKEKTRHMDHNRKRHQPMIM